MHEASKSRGWLWYARAGCLLIMVANGVWAALYLLAVTTPKPPLWVHAVVVLASLWLIFDSLILGPRAGREPRS